jgi:hypothetical protein
MAMSYFNLLDGRTSVSEILNIRSAQQAAQDALSAQADEAAVFSMRIESLQRLLLVQHDQIAKLQSALGVLAAVLRDNGMVNAEILDARLEAAMLNAEEETATAQAKAQATTTCTSCRREVAKRQTTMTDDGVMCDACFARR